MIKYKVWWIPQVPMISFDVEASSLEEARKIEMVLADYDTFQFENRVKGDYCNAGGVVFMHPITDGEWWDVPSDEDEWKEYLLDIKAYEDGP